LIFLDREDYISNGQIQGGTAITHINEIVKFLEIFILVTFLSFCSQWYTENHITFNTSIQSRLTPPFIAVTHTDTAGETPWTER
jgi:hypothetical protein